MIVVMIGFGEENEVFKRCRKVWDLCVSTINIPDVKIIFFQTIYHQEEETIFEGSDLFIKNSFPKGSVRKDQISNYVEEINVPSDWTKLGNLETVSRNQKATKWVLDTFSDCTHIFFTTITSIFSIQILKALTDLLPKVNVFAGSINIYNKILGLEKFIFISGANTLMSSDIAKLTVAKTDLDYIGLPNDIWLSLRLAEKPKMYLPRHDITKAPKELGEDCDLGVEIDAALGIGHFHFRVKSSGNRALTDHIILLDIYRKFYFGRTPLLEDVLKLTSSMGLPRQY